MRKLLCLLLLACCSCTFVDVWDPVADHRVGRCNERADENLLACVARVCSHGYNMMPIVSQDHVINIRCKP